MKFILDNWMLISVAFVSGALLVWPAVGRGTRGGQLSANDAVLLMNREKAVVVDVCEPHEFSAGHVVGAKSVPLGQLQQRLPEVVKNKNVPVILVCARGMRAQRALSVAKSLGYEKAQVLSGGMNAWKEANLPVEKT